MTRFWNKANCSTPSSRTAPKTTPSSSRCWPPTWSTVRPATKCVCSTATARPVWARTCRRRSARRWRPADGPSWSSRPISWKPSGVASSTSQPFTNCSRTGASVSSSSWWVTSPTRTWTRTWSSTSRPTLTFSGASCDSGTSYATPCPTSSATSGQIPSPTDTCTAPDLRAD